MRDWLVEVRKKQNLSQADVAAKAGIAQSYYAAIETGDRGKPLNVDIGKAIAGVLGFDWTRFYDDIGEKAANQ